MQISDNKVLRNAFESTLVKGAYGKKQNKEILTGRKSVKAL